MYDNGKKTVPTLGSEQQSADKDFNRFRLTVQYKCYMQYHVRTNRYSRLNAASITMLHHLSFDNKL